MIETLFYWLGAVTGFTLLLTALTAALFFLRSMWRDWFDKWMKVDTGRLATFMRVTFERGHTDIDQVWRVDGRRLKIVDLNENPTEGGN